jgi:hypothetical protein
MDRLPPLLNDFIRSIAPKADKGPVTELQERYEERRRERLRELNGIQPINHPHGTPEFLVEMRIRDWVRRMEAEKAEFERRRKANAAAPPPKPPAPKP